MARPRQSRGRRFPGPIGATSTGHEAWLIRRRIAGTCSLLLRAASFWMTPGCCDKLSRHRGLQVASVGDGLSLRSIISRTSQIWNASNVESISSNFFWSCQNDPEFNSREGVSFTGAVLCVSAWGRLGKPLWTQGWTFMSDGFVLAPSLGKQGGASVASKLTGNAHSEFEKWLLAGDENQSRFVR
jgi:hypothetical protein